MNSFAVIQPGIIGELFKPEQSARSGEFDGNSYFHQITYQADELTKEVKLNWKELSEEKRQILRDLANDAYELKSPKEKQPFNFQRQFLRIRMAIAILRGQQDTIFSAAHATYKLLSAVMDAVEQEESNVSMATIYLKNGETATLPVSEVDEYLQANSEKLEPKRIKTRRPRMQGKSLF
ncbi:hypothetical protein ACQ4M3_33800 [Leptolyngbya sp. AN03gr2]|uniref:hypothetical protein n=1 Tax=unclassified Leptolyngbya TaxID=2650499 RepID=UPI003D314964